MAIQLMGLYSQALIEWNGTPVATRIWDGLRTHFTIAYIVCEQSGTGTTGNNGYHGAANLTTNDNTLNNIESALNSELANLHTANNAHPQTALAGIAELCTAITATQQQLALLAVQLPTTAPPAYKHYTHGGGCGNHCSHGSQRRIMAHHCQHTHRPFLPQEASRWHQPQDKTTAESNRLIPTNGITTTTTVSHVATTSQFGTLAPLVRTASKTTRLDAHIRMWHSTRHWGTFAPSAACTALSCPPTPRLNKPDMEGRWSQRFK